ncbi:MAG: hypothetical protein SOZ22_01330 [Ezakiella sp.]|nr:hypothetical protein [Bacillota bacterium]MDY3922974.1 hypothetical protein [Ezakiella sp.]
MFEIYPIWKISGNNSKLFNLPITGRKNVKGAIKGSRKKNKLNNSSKESEFSGEVLV